MLLSLSTGGLSSFAVVAFTGGYGTTLATANAALSAYLLASAFGVLAGGVIADRTRRHGDIAALGFGIAGLLILGVGSLPLPPALLILVMGTAGLCNGMIAPSRDMLVRAAAPPGAAGRVFGIVSTGLNLGGAVSPILFGWIVDHGAPRWVFWGSALFMAATVAMALATERRRSPHPAAAAAAVPR
jgi:MFS family permease